MFSEIFFYIPKESINLRKLLRSSEANSLSKSLAGHRMKKANNPGLLKILGEIHGEKMASLKFQLITSLLE